MKLLTEHPELVFGVSFPRPDRMRIVAGSNDKTLRLFRDLAPQSHPVLKGHTDQVINAVFAPDGKQIASASADGTVRFADALRVAREGAAERPRLRAL